MAFILSKKSHNGRAAYYDGAPAPDRWDYRKEKARRYGLLSHARAEARCLADAERVSISVESVASAKKNPAKRRAKKKSLPRKKKTLPRAKVTTTLRTSKTKTVVRKNPAGQSALRQAVKLYRDFRGEEPRGFVKVKMPALPTAMLTVGECLGIMYRTRRDGKVEDYLHRFAKKARPTLAVSSDGLQLFLLGGAYSVTDRGIEDDAR